MNTSMKRQKGLVAIEFALAFPAFIMMVLLWVEISYLGFVSSVADMASTTATRQARGVDIDLDDNNATYDQVIQAVLNQTDSFWKNFIDPTKFTFTACYFKDISAADLADLVGCNTDAKDNPVALFQVSYKHTPIYSIFTGDINLSREMIVVLEFERGL